jgi:predicted alpha/beta-hydrolase family hydrolase
MALVYEDQPTAVKSTIFVAASRFRRLPATDHRHGNTRSPVNEGHDDAPSLLERSRSVFTQRLRRRRECPGLALSEPEPHGRLRQLDRARAGLEAAVQAMRCFGVDRLVLGGLSYLGRRARMLASDVPDLAQSLLLFSYSLHPPGRPGEPQTAHPPRLRTPTVFVHGSRDRFASPREIRQAVGMIPAPTRLVEIEGAGRDLQPGRRITGETHREIAARALQALRDLAALSSRPPGRQC